jgi:hypothetical protein
VQAISDARDNRPLNSEDDRAIRTAQGPAGPARGQLKRRWYARLAHLIHIDATIQLLDPSLDLDTPLPISGPSSTPGYFATGSWGRKLLGTLRVAEGKSLSSPAIVTFVMQEHDIEKVVWRTVVQPVRSNRWYVERCGNITRTRRGIAVRWNLH